MPSLLIESTDSMIVCFSPSVDALYSCRTLLTASQIESDVYDKLDTTAQYCIPWREQNLIIYKNIAYCTKYIILLCFNV